MERERNKDGPIDSETDPFITVEWATWVKMWPGMGRLNLWFGEVERFRVCQSRAWVARTDHRSLEMRSD